MDCEVEMIIKFLKETDILRNINVMHNLQDQHYNNSALYSQMTLALGKLIHN